MRPFRNLIWAMTAAALVLMLAPVAMAGGNCCPDEGEGQLAQLDYGRSDVRWQVFAEHAQVRLTVSTPCGVFDRVYDKGEAPFFDIGELGEEDPNGRYTWQIRIDPVVDPAVQKALKEARESGDDRIVGELRRKGLLPAGPFIQTGEFSVIDNAIVDPGTVEKSGEKSSVRQASSSRLEGGFEGGVDDLGAPGVGRAVDETVISGDLTVYNSLCVGFDCLASEAYGSDTIRLKENNLRIHVEDTSGGTFPTTDWRLEFNSNTNGGQSYFRVIDATASRNIMTLEAGAPSNALVVDNSGRMGLGTANPVVELHVTNGDTPTLRLEQTTASGFGAQTWDIAGNETNFFVRDSTNGSTLPFRIFPGASSNRLVIDDSDTVGIGTTSPDTLLTVQSAASNADVVKVRRSGSSDSLFRIFEASTGEGVFSVFNATNGENIRFTGQAQGRVAIGCASGLAADLTLNAAGGGACGGGTESTINAGATQFTVTSSRSIKENLSPVKVDGILERIAGIDVYTYDFINGPEDALGLMAEDFHQVFGRGSDRHINGQEVEMALWLAVQELSKQNERLAQEVETLKAERFED